MSRKVVKNICKIQNCKIFYRVRKIVWKSLKNILNFFYFYFISQYRSDRAGCVLTNWSLLLWYCTVRQFKSWMKSEGFALRVGVDGTKSSHGKGGAVCWFCHVRHVSVPPLTRHTSTLKSLPKCFSMSNSLGALLKWSTSIDSFKYLWVSTSLPPLTPAH